MAKEGQAMRKKRKLVDIQEKKSIVLGMFCVNVKQCPHLTTCFFLFKRVQMNNFEHN